MYVDDVVEGMFHRLCIHEPHGQNAADRSMGLTAAGRTARAGHGVRRPVCHRHVGSAKGGAILVAAPGASIRTVGFTSSSPRAWKLFPPGCPG
jgi:hypothetical protein